jgi:hypothetical protein
MMYGDGFFAFQTAALVPIALISLPFAIGFYFVAGRLGRHQLLWAVLALIPFVNFFFFIYASFAILLHVLDKIEEAASQHRNSES